MEVGPINCPLHLQPIGCTIVYPLSGKDLVRQLKKLGWKLERINGSHHIMTKGKKTVTIPVHGNRSLGKGLETKLLKQTGLKK